MGRIIGPLKFHYATHIAEQFELWGVVIMCFIHERKHKEIKRYISARLNYTASYAKSVLVDVLHMQKLVLREALPYPRGTVLLSPRRATADVRSFLQEHFAGEADFMTSVDAKVNNFTNCHVGDVVFVKWEQGIMAVGQLLVLFTLAGAPDECMCCVRMWTQMPQRNMYNTQGHGCFMRLVNVIDTCVYRMSDSVAYVVPPSGVVHARHCLQWK